MRVLWISLRIFEENEETQTAVWLKALANKLMSSPEIILGNISCIDNISELTECDYRDVKQWALPFDKNNKKGYPSHSTRQRFSKVIHEFNPDIIQIWGSENFFQLLPFDEVYPGIKVLTMQGVLSSIAPVLLSGLNKRDLLSSIGIREIFKCRNLFSEKKSFEKAGMIESEMIRKSNFIITQSDWTDSQIRYLNPKAKFYRTHRVLRDSIVNSEKWINFEHTNHILYSAAVGYSLKGLHVLIMALSIVKKQFPNIELRLAGATGRKDFLGDGYLRVILRLIKKNDLVENVTWLGPITADEIVKNLQEASAFINPSFVESYSLSLAEAMSVGTPAIVSFAGAMSELAVNIKEALFFSPGDYKHCAFLISSLLTNKNLSFEISENAVKRAEDRNIRVNIVDEQLNIYNNIISQGGKLNGA